MIKYNDIKDFSAVVKNAKFQARLELLMKRKLKRKTH